MSSSAGRYDQPELARKAEVFFSAIRRISEAPSETEACVEILAALESLYLYSMISFLRTIGDDRFIVGEKAFAVGEKWKRVAEETNRPCELPEDELDLLPYILLVSGKSRFIPDSRVDPRNDRPLCLQLRIISQYAVPLRTQSMRIGTFQVDMGHCDIEPVQECAMLDALAAHLSSAIERCRLLERRQVLESELLSKTRLIEWSSGVANAMHGLRREILGYQKDYLNEAMKNQKIRGNEEALSFLRETERHVQGWVALAEEEREKARDIISGAQPLDVAAVVTEAIRDKVRFLRRYACTISVECASRDVSVRARPATLAEILSCLIVNAAEAHARSITIHVSRTLRRIDPDTDKDARPCVQIVVADDGEGIPLVFQDKIQKFGWTSKTKSGTGIGLTVVDLLTRGLGGRLLLRSGGKSAGQELTEFCMLIPAAS